MKRDLLIGSCFVALAVTGIGTVVAFLNTPEDAVAPKTIKPKVEPLALLPVKATREEPKPTVRAIPKIPLLSVVATPKKTDAPAREVPKVAVRPAPIAPIKEEPKVAVRPAPIAPIKEEPKVIAKAVEVKKIPEPPADAAGDVIALGDWRTILRPGGAYKVPALMNEDRTILAGKVKTLHLSSAGGKAIIDASALSAQEIIVTGAIQDDARVKLHAPGGTVLIQAPLRGNAELEIIAPGGKVVFQGPTGILAGGARLIIVARDVELNGDISGGTQATVTLTRNGSLKFSKLQGGPRLHYRKADPADPEPRIEKGSILGGAELRKLETARK